MWNNHFYQSSFCGSLVILVHPVFHTVSKKIHIFEAMHLSIWSLLSTAKHITCKPTFLYLCTYSWSRFGWYYWQMKCVLRYIRGKQIVILYSIEVSIQFLRMRFLLECFWLVNRCKLNSYYKYVLIVTLFLRHHQLSSSLLT